MSDEQKTETEPQAGDAAAADGEPSKTLTEQFDEAEKVIREVGGGVSKITAAGRPPLEAVIEDIGYLGEVVYRAKARIDRHSQDRIAEFTGDLLARGLISADASAMVQSVISSDLEFQRAGMGVAGDIVVGGIRVVMETLLNPLGQIAKSLGLSSVGEGDAPAGVGLISSVLKSVISPDSPGEAEPVEGPSDAD